MRVGKVVVIRAILHDSCYLVANRIKIDSFLQVVLEMYAHSICYFSLRVCFLKVLLLFLRYISLMLP